MLKRLALETRASAGTGSPGTNWIVSPGTIRSESSTSSRPSRRTRTGVAAERLKAAMARWPVRSVAAPTAALAPSTSAIKPASSIPPVRTETTMPAPSSTVGALASWSTTSRASEGWVGSGIRLGPWRRNRSAAPCGRQPQAWIDLQAGGDVGDVQGVPGDRGSVGRWRGLLAPGYARPG